ncbi:hypothetical protein L6452_35210 [Arctium lappa]|uniref:Uncharacterized protein n=1 Tax=Arctium lappa TaxID=4217 RepID=A0ACB8Y6W9_ARCLA|nr:hypothetical protein L6452_35210 [Arctium lappa]
MGLGSLLSFAWSVILVAQPDDRGMISASNNIKETRKTSFSSGFRILLHYPRYQKGDYEKMEEWRLDLLLEQYGLSFDGCLEEKRAYAMGAFLWPHQL